MQGEQFNPTWLVIARQSRGITQKELAHLLSVNQGWLSRIENGLRSIPNDKIAEIAALLDYPEEFFFQHDPPYLRGLADIFHRKIEIADKVLDRINAQLTVVSTRVAQLLEGVEIDGTDIAPVDLEEFTGTIEDIALMVRSNWGVPRGPIQNLTKLIENANAIVIPFDFGTRRIDAAGICFPKAKPLFFVNTLSPGDRLRFTLCHELGHIVMHQHTVRPNGEEEASKFAAEFLMPAHQIRPYLDDLSLPKLAALKIQWRVSMAALLKRAHSLGAVTPARARALWMQMSQYKQREPKELDIPVEVPSLYKEIIDVYQNDLEYDAAEMSKLLQLSEGDTRKFFLEPPQYDLAKDAIDEAEQIIRGNITT